MGLADFLYCAQVGKCQVGQQPIDAADDCETQDDCMNGGSCTLVGVCPSSGAACALVGDPCTGGAASETCTAIPSYCEDPFGLVDPAICDQKRYVQPAVGMGPLPLAATAISNALGLAYPRSGTPMTAALNGAYQYLHDYAAAHAGHKVVLVLATD